MKVTLTHVCIKWDPDDPTLSCLCSVMTLSEKRNKFSKPDL